MPPATAAGKAPSPMKNRPALAWWGALPALIVILTSLLFAWHSLGDLDIWFHLRSGQDLMSGQGGSAVNSYSFTEPDHPWVNHEWMFQVLTAVTGPRISAPASGEFDLDVTAWNLMRTLLVLLLMGIVLTGDGVAARILGRRGPAAATWSTLPLLAGLLLLWPRLTLRPELFSYVFFVLAIRWTERSFSPSLSTQAPAPWWAMVDPRRLEGKIVLLTVIWAQFHGFASLVPLLLLLGGLLAWIQNRWFSGDSARPGSASSPKRVAILVGLTLVALSLTPNGLGGLVMPLRALGQFSGSQVDLRTTISELVPLLESPNSLGRTIVIFQASLIWGLVWIVLTLGRISLLRILVFLLAALAAWSNQRSIGFYALAFMLLHTGTGALAWRRPLLDKMPGLRPSLVAAAGLTVSLLTAAWLWPPLLGDDFYLTEGVGRRFGTGVNPARYPVAAAAAMTRQDVSRYFANLDAAGFLLALSPGRTFIDGRTEAYSPELWNEYLAIKRGGEKALEQLDARRVEAVCLATAGAAFHRLGLELLDSPDWVLWAAEDAGLLFRPAGKADLSGARSDSKENRDILVKAATRSLAAAEKGSPARRADHCLAAGQLLLFAGDVKQQEAAYRQGLSFKSDHPTLNHNLGNLILGQQRFADALPHFQTALDKNPRLAGSALNAGVCQMRLGRPEAAADSFRRAAAIDPNRFEAWANLTAALKATGDLNGAIRALERAVELQPENRRLIQQLNRLKGGVRD